MKTGDKLTVLQILKSRRVPWNSTCEAMPTGSAGQREVSVGGLADKPAGLTHSLGVFKQLSSVYFSSVLSSPF